MCMQCMAGAMTAVGVASGLRAYLGRVRAVWLTPRRLRALTVALVIGAVIAPATLLSGSGAASAADQGAPAAQR
jgi:Sec-independent protein secretion pathway component TatC